MDRTDGNQQIPFPSQIVAGDLIQQALLVEFPWASAIDGDLAGDYTGEDGGILVFAHSVSPSCQAYSRADGMAWIERNLPKMSWARPIHVIGFLEPQEYGRYAYLLDEQAGVGYTHLPAAVSEISPSPLIDEERRLTLALAASENQMELHFASQRHSFGGLAAAVRIYLGMLLIKHAPSHNCAQTLARLAEAARSQGMATVQVERIPLHLSQHHALINRIRKRDKKLLPSHYALRRAHIPIVMLDDQYQTHLWDVVLRHVSGEDGFKGFSTWADLQTELMDAELPAQTVFLLDCNLGPGANVFTGLELLRAIRTARPEIPLVLMSSYDDAQLALTSMRGGANDYFVKELGDRSDRRSLDYYLHFRKTVDRLDAEYMRAVEAWRCFVGKLDANGRLGKLDNLPSTFEMQLRWAFHLLFSAIETNRVAKWDADAIPEVDAQNAGRPVIATLAAGVDQPGQARELLRRVHHSHRPLTINDALKCIEYFIAARLPSRGDVNRIRVGEPRMPSFSPYSSTALQTDGRHPGLRSGEMRLSHSDAGIRATAELGRGWVCERRCKHSHGTLKQVLAAHEETKKDTGKYDAVLVLDDEGDTNGWFDVLSKAFPNIRCQQYVHNRDNAKHAIFEEGFDKFNAVLLDLRIPTVADGLDLLHRIHIQDPGLPIVVASASTDALDAIRSMEAGAADFISKSLPFDRTVDQCQEFYFDLRAKLLLAQRLGASRLRKFTHEANRIAQDSVWRCEKNKTRNIEQALKKRPCGSSTRGWVTPPEPDSIGRALAADLGSILSIYKSCWLALAAERMVPSHDLRKVAQHWRTQDVQIVPLDNWRIWALGIASGTRSRSAWTPLIKMGIVLSGALVDKLAVWNWCWKHKKPLNLDYWGTDDPSAIVIAHEIEETFGDEVAELWSWRNAALYVTAQNVPEKGWTLQTLEECIARLLSAVGTIEKNSANY